MPRKDKWAFATGAAGAALALAVALLWPSGAPRGPGCPYLPRGSFLGAVVGRFWPNMFDGAQYDSTGLRYYTREELAKYDGSDPSLPLLLGMNGDVFDVTEKGSGFYGKGAAYNCFAGKDSTRALSIGSLEEDDLYRVDISDFTPEQHKAVKEQHDFYLGKYVLVGRIVPDSPPPPRPAPSATAEAAAQVEPGTTAAGSAPADAAPAAAA